MLHFLEGVRVIPILGAGVSTPAKDQSDSDGTTTEVDSANGKIVVHKHSSGGSEFLAVPICAIVFTFIYLIIKAIMAPFTQRARNAKQVPGGSGGLTQEEVAVLQKLQRTLSQMESRVEALETILIEQARTEKNYGPKL